MSETIALALGVGLLSLLVVRFVVATHRGRRTRLQRAAIYQSAHDYLARGGGPLRLVPDPPPAPPAWPVHWSVYAGPHDLERGARARSRPTLPPLRQVVATEPRLESETDLDASVFVDLIRFCPNGDPAVAFVAESGGHTGKLEGGGGEFGGGGASSSWDAEPSSVRSSDDDQ